MKLLIVDNYDSFTYNLVHLAKKCGVTEITVKRNDKISPAEAKEFSAIILSPGPGIPLEAGNMPAIVRELLPSHPIFGVCLGHQCIGEICGGTLKNIGAPVHGRALPLTVKNSESPLFRNLPNVFSVGRYHSWVVDKDSLGHTELEVTAVDQAGEVMAFAHRKYPVHGVQFHPESVLTEHGETLFSNWITYAQNP